MTSEVEKGQPIFRLDSSSQQAAVDVAQRRIAEIDASMPVARADIASAEALIQQAQSAEQQVLDELRTKRELVRRDPGNVAARDIEKLQNHGCWPKGWRLRLPKRRGWRLKRVSAHCCRRRKRPHRPHSSRLKVDLSKTVVYAGVSGRVEQFVLRVGDIVNPLMRPAGVLIPAEAGRRGLLAGFGRIEAQVIKTGMAAEVTCISKPLTIIPMIVSDVQDAIAAGQVRAGEQLIDAQRVTAPGTISVYLEPLFKGTMDDVPPGSTCIANLYTNNHERLAKEKLSVGTWLYLHVIDAVALVHALMLARAGAAASHQDSGADTALSGSSVVPQLPNWLCAGIKARSPFIAAERAPRADINTAYIHPPATFGRCGYSHAAVILPQQ